MLNVKYVVVKKRTFWWNLYEFFYNLANPVENRLHIVEHRAAMRTWKKQTGDISDLSKILNSGKTFEPEVMSMLREYIDDTENLREALDKYEEKHEIIRRIK